MKKIILAIFLLIILIFPIGVSCGRLFKTCTTPPDENEYIHRTVIYKPFGIALLELITGLDIPIIYRELETRQLISNPKS